jgi:hypothetical protein
MGISPIPEQKAFSHFAVTRKWRIVPDRFCQCGDPARRHPDMYNLWGCLRCNKATFDNKDFSYGPPEAISRESQTL